MSKRSYILLIVIGVVILLLLSNSKSNQFDGSISGKPWGTDYPRTRKEQEREDKIKSGWKPSNNGYIPPKPGHHQTLEDALSDPYIIDRLEDETRR